MPAKERIPSLFLHHVGDAAVLANVLDKDGLLVLGDPARELISHLDGAESPLILLRKANADYPFQGVFAFIEQKYCASLQLGDFQEMLHCLLQNIGDIRGTSYYLGNGIDYRKLLIPSLHFGLILTSGPSSH
jgi:hypothetical protein